MWKAAAVVLAAAAAPASPVSTAPVTKGRLSNMVSQYGTLTYRARPDGSPYAVINRARGTYTELPAAGDEVDCGKVLYRVNDHPVLLLCGPTPAYRSLSRGAHGPDAAELNANLVELGYASPAQLEPSSGRFTAATAAALEKLQATLGEERTGSLDLGRAVFLPEPVRITRVTGELGALARPGAAVLRATSGTLEVQVALAPSQQGEVKRGDRAQITLPGNDVVTGKVARLGEVGRILPVYIRLDHPQQAGGLAPAPVQVNITTTVIESALSVPVTAIVGRAGGGFAVEVVRARGRRELVAVRLGLFDTAGGRVQILDGDLHQGERVVVPSS